MVESKNLPTSIKKSGRRKCSCSEKNRKERLPKAVRMKVNHKIEDNDTFIPS